jgi:hypothetical protein
MAHPVARAIILLLLPMAVLFGGSWLISKESGRERVLQALKTLPAKADRTPLGLRWRLYDAAAVHRHWTPMKEHGVLGVEKQVFQLDLVLPVFIAAAFLFSLVLAWTSWGRPFPVSYLAIPAILMLVADWTENTRLLGQIDRMAAGQALQADQIRLASVGTGLKLLTFILMTAVLAYNVYAAFQASRQDG